VYGGNIKGLNEKVQQYILSAYLDPARKRGETTIRIKAGDVHRDLHWVNRVPSVCTTLGSKKFQRETGLELVSKEGPPSGYSTTVVYTYRLSSPESASDKSGPRKSRLEALYGTLAEVYRELGGSENFIHSERERLHFRKDEDEPTNDKDEQ
jgi:hypothetical protein